MIITLLILACVLLSVAVVILFAVLKKQRAEISALKICVCSLGENYELLDENYKLLDDFTDSIYDKVERLDYFADIVSKYGKVVIEKKDETT